MTDFSHHARILMINPENTGQFIEGETLHDISFISSPSCRVYITRETDRSTVIKLCSRNFATSGFAIIDVDQGGIYCSNEEIKNTFSGAIPSGQGWSIAVNGERPTLIH